MASFGVCTLPCTPFRFQLICLYYATDTWGHPPRLTYQGMRILGIPIGLTPHLDGQMKTRAIKGTARAWYALDNGARTALELAETCYADQKGKGPGCRLLLELASRMLDNDASRLKEVKGGWAGFWCGLMSRHDQGLEHVAPI